jgi:hypothetical protein
VDTKTALKKTRSRKTLNAANLEALGPARLAAVLLQLAEDDPAVKRRLRMELAAEVGSDDLILELVKRLDVVASAGGRVHWRKLKMLRQELDLLRMMIADRLANAAPAAAVGMMLSFLGMERGVLARVKDTKGEVGQVFLNALEDLARVGAGVTNTSPEAVDLTMDALEKARIGAMGPIIQAVLPSLDPTAVTQLRARIESEMAPRRRVNAGWRDALQAILDAQGDAKAYAATYSSSEAVLPPIGARIARRFLKAGQIAEAEQALEQANPYTEASARPAGSTSTPKVEPGLLAWERAWIDLLEAKGEEQAAQEARWAAFERDLAADHLGAYLRKLADFDDVVALDRAITHARTYRPFTTALDFLIRLPALSEAADLVATRAHEIDGLEVDRLEPAVRALEARHPLAAMIVLRAMVRDVVKFSQADLYARAQAWLLEAASLASQIDDLRGHEDQTTFENRVRAILPR